MKFDNLLIPGTEESYDNAIRLFDGHFKPKSNISYEIYAFRKLKENAGETISKFLYVSNNKQLNVILDKT